MPLQSAMNDFVESFAAVCLPIDLPLHGVPGSKSENGLNSMHTITGATSDRVSVECR